MRSEIYTMLLKAGVMPDDARTVEDLADHAVTEAVQAMIRVCDAAPDHLKAKTLAIATAKICLKTDASMQHMTIIALANKFKKETL